MTDLNPLKRKCAVSVEQSAPSMIDPMIQMISAAKIQILFKSGTFVKSRGARSPRPYVCALSEEYYSLLHSFKIGLYRRQLPNV